MSKDEQERAVEFLTKEIKRVCVKPHTEEDIEFIVRRAFNRGISYAKRKVHKVMQRNLAELSEIL